MAKANFKTNNPLDNLSKTSNVAHDPEREYTKKRKVGRPKTKLEPTRNINIAVPVSILDRMGEIKACYGGNMTRYINSLIEKDLEENYQKYKDAINILTWI